jgi:hypothetical protein
VHHAGAGFGTLFAFNFSNASCNWFQLTARRAATRQVDLIFGLLWSM